MVIVVNGVGYAELREAFKQGEIMPHTEILLGDSRYFFNEVGEFYECGREERPKRILNFSKLEKLPWGAIKSRQDPIPTKPLFS